MDPLDEVLEGLVARLGPEQAEGRHPEVLAGGTEAGREALGKQRPAVVLETLRGGRPRHLDTKAVSPEREVLAVEALLAAHAVSVGHHARAIGSGRQRPVAVRAHGHVVARRQRLLEPAFGAPRGDDVHAAERGLSRAQRIAGGERDQGPALGGIGVARERPESAVGEDPVLVVIEERDSRQPIRAVDEDPAPVQEGRVPSDGFQAGVEVLAAPTVDLAIRALRHGRPGQEGRALLHLAHRERADARPRQPQAAVTQVRPLRVVGGHAVLHREGAQANDLGPVRAPAQQALDDPAGQVPIGNVHAVRLEESGLAAQVLLEGLEPHLHQELGQRVPVLRAARALDLGPLGLDPVADDRLQHRFGRAELVVGEVDLVAVGGAQEEQRAAVVAAVSGGRVVDGERRPALRAGEEEYQGSGGCRRLGGRGHGGGRC